MVLHLGIVALLLAISPNTGGPRVKPATHQPPDKNRGRKSPIRASNMAAQSRLIRGPKARRDT